ncbi:alpha/beta fold hydrolase [Acetobacter sp.]|uniref:alpha/beta fold hydrolase n=1 Tax=Acetobacter sp. TaxID=440 RepID=UPI0039EB7A1B
MMAIRSVLTTQAQGGTLRWLESGPTGSPTDVPKGSPIERPVGSPMGNASGGQTLVLLHGIGSDAQAWRAQLEGFAPRHRVLAWNAPGYAGSTPFPPAAHPANPSCWARALAAGLDGLGVERCVLVGHSLGAVTATRFAVENPHRVAKLVLSSPARGYGQPPGESLLPALQARVDDIATLGPAGMAARRAPRTLTPDATPAQIEAATAAMARVSAQGYQDAVHLLAGAKLVADLTRWQGDTDFIAADGDQIVPAEIVQAVARTCPGAGLHLIHGAGHASYLQAPDQFNRILADVLAR